MAVASDTETASAASRRWLYGPVPDLFLGCGILYGVVVAIYAIAGSQLRALHPVYLLSLLILLTTMPHYGATLLRVYEHRADRRGYVIFSVYATIAVFAAYAYGVYNTYFASVLLTIYLTWSPWHYSGQNYGIAVMFLHRRGIPVDPLSKRLLHWSFGLSYVMVFFVFHASESVVSYDPASLTGSQVNFLPLGIPLSIANIIFPAVLAGYLGCIIGASIRLLRKASPADLGPSAMLVLTQALWFSVPFCVRYTGFETGIEPFDQLSIRFYVILTAVAHAVQYLWVTTYYAEASPGFRGRFSYLRKVAMAGLAVWTIPVILFAPDGIGTLSYDAGLALLLAAAVNIHHFILDGAIWKLRSSRVGNILIRDVPEIPEEALVEHAWLRRVVWAAVAGAAAIAVVIFWERDVKIPRVVAAREYAKASATLDRLAWVGRDDSTIRLKLTEEASRRGDLPLAIEQARRLVVLRSSVSAHGELAKFLELDGDWEGALGQYQAGRRIDPEHPALIRGAALALLKLNRPEEALDLLEPLSIRFPTDSETLLGIERARSMP